MMIEIRLQWFALPFLAVGLLIAGCSSAGSKGVTAGSPSAPASTLTTEPGASTPPMTTTLPASSGAPLAEDAVAHVAAIAKPGIVQITNEQQSLQGSGALTPVGVGTGFVLDNQGHILTNNHVVAEAQRLQVQTTDGKSYPAKLVGRDPNTDIAVVQVEGQQLPTVQLGDSDKLVVGQWVVAIGNALALPGGPTVTQGVVSAVGRTAQEPADTSATASGDTTANPGPFLFDLIQTDAAINPGNSGGPLLNLQGEVVGINTLGAGQAEPGVQSQGISFAIAINTAKGVADQLIRTGKVVHADLGAITVPNTPALAARFGLAQQPGMIVVDVTPDGPAAQAGLQPKDVIVAVDGAPLSSESDLARVLASHQPGDIVTVSLATVGATRDAKVTLGIAPSPQ